MRGAPATAVGPRPGRPFPSPGDTGRVIGVGSIRALAGGPATGQVGRLRVALTHPDGSYDTDAVAAYLAEHEVSVHL